MKSLGKDEEERQRHQIAEKDHHPLPEREPDIDLNQRQISVHSRSLFPVNSMNTSSSVGRARCTSSRPTPCASTHLTISTKVRAGLLEATVRCRPSSLILVCVASGHSGIARPCSVSPQKISIVDFP